VIDTVHFNNNNNQLYVRIGYAGIFIANGGYITELKVYKSDDPNTSVLVILHNGTSFNYLIIIFLCCCPSFALRLPFVCPVVFNSSW